MPPDRASLTPTPSLLRWAPRPHAWPPALPQAERSPPTAPRSACEALPEARSACLGSGTPGPAWFFSTIPTPPAPPTSVHQVQALARCARRLADPLSSLIRGGCEPGPSGSDSHECVLLSVVGPVLRCRHPTATDRAAMRGGTRSIVTNTPRQTHLGRRAGPMRPRGRDTHGGCSTSGLPVL